MSIFSFWKPKDEHIKQVDKLFETANTQVGLLYIILMNNAKSMTEEISKSGQWHFFERRVLIACVGISHIGINIYVPRKDRNRQAKAILIRLDSLDEIAKKDMYDLWNYLEHFTKQGRPLDEALGAWIISGLISQPDAGNIKIEFDKLTGREVGEIYNRLGSSITLVFDDFFERD